MGLIMSPIEIHECAWVKSSCVVLGGVTIGRSALVKPLTSVTSDVEENALWDNSGRVGTRFA